MANKRGRIPTPVEFSDRLAVAYLLGAFITDGYAAKHFRLSKGNQYFVRFFPGSSRQFGEVIVSKLSSLGLKTRVVKRYSRENQYFIQIYSKILFLFLSDLNKEVLTAWVASDKEKRQFLGGCFDGDGTMHKRRPAVSFWNTNKEWINIVNEMLMSLGFNPHIYEIKRDSSRKIAYNLLLNVSDTHKFMETIGFSKY